MKVFIGPVKSGGLVLRGVKFPDGSARSEIWDGSAWVPGGDFAGFFTAAPMSPEALEAFGIPS